ncbi:DUF2157 domain-containing protein [Flavobacterium sp. TAB 87]|uniref:DUF2157 domain-containing protein n=1 Tax=Flavobacterium sp. TAB 87 TaxID=1729581 RepID=UPI00076DA380|nr:DUF2157 domain-containing protein [Flavobacterium sp. TAB 87]KVV14630.1 hypothetical protein AP058_01683 [Flavobacterium sp. TAB 87]
MSSFEEKSTLKLFEKNFITENQFNQIKEYRGLGIFSLHAELKLALYLSVLLFTSGVGILIYNNIDTIGHVAILSLLVITIAVCFYFSFKNSNGFSRAETQFENPVLDYVVLGANILTCTFIGYLQFQYNAFGTLYGLATLIPTIICFFSAYYFDNKSVLSIAITGLAAYIGLTVTPRALLSEEFYATEGLSFSAIALGIALIAWTIYSKRTILKTHFSLIFFTFALHLIGLVSITNLVHFNSAIWLLFLIILGVACFYFYKISYEIKSISLYVFTIIYAYIGLNLVIAQLFTIIDFDDIWELLIVLLPFYFVTSIVIFIKLIKKFNKLKN